MPNLNELKRGGSASAGAYYELQEKYDALLQEKAELEEKLNKAEAQSQQAKDLKSDLKKAERKLKELEEEVAKKLAEQERAFRAEKEESERKIKDHYENVISQMDNSASDNVAELEKVIDDANYNLLKMESEAYEKMVEANALKKSNADYVAQAIEAIEKYQEVVKEVKEFEEFVKELSEVVAEKESAIAQKDAKNAELMKKYKGSILNTNNYKRFWELQKQKAEKAIAENKTIKTELDRTKKANVKLSEDVNAMTGKVANLETELEADKAQISSQQIKISRQDLRAKSQAREVYTTKNSLNRASNTIQGLNVKLSESETSRIKAESDKIKAQMSAMQEKERANQAEADLSVAKDKWGKAQEHVREQKLRANQAEADLSVAKKENEETKEKLNTANKGLVKNRRGFRIAAVAAGVALVAGLGVAGLLNSNLTAAKDENKVISAEKETLAVENETLTSENQAKDEVIGGLTGDLADKDQEIAEKDQAITVAEQDKLIKEMNSVIVEISGNAKAVNSNKGYADTLNALGYGNSVVVGVNEVVVSHYDNILNAQKEVENIVSFDGENIDQTCALAEAYVDYQTAVRASDKDGMEEYSNEISLYQATVSQAKDLSELSFNEMLSEAGITSAEEIARLLEEKNTAETERDEAKEENEKLQEENKNLSDENKNLSDENDQLTEENDNLKQENDSLKQENEQLSTPAVKFDVSAQECKPYADFLTDKGNLGAVENAFCDYNKGNVTLFVKCSDFDANMQKVSVIKYVTFKVDASKFANSNLNFSQIMDAMNGNIESEWIFTESLENDINGKEVVVDGVTGTAQTLFAYKKIGKSYKGAALVIVKDQAGNVVCNKVIADEFNLGSMEKIKKSIVEKVESTVELAEANENEL